MGMHRHDLALGEKALQKGKQRLRSRATQGSGECSPSQGSGGSPPEPTGISLTRQCWRQRPRIDQVMLSSYYAADCVKGTSLKKYESIFCSVLKCKQCLLEQQDVHLQCYPIGGLKARRPAIEDSNT